jgi:hypothetical protein
MIKHWKPLSGYCLYFLLPGTSALGLMCGCSGKVYLCKAVLTLRGGYQETNQN